MRKLPDASWNPFLTLRRNYAGGSKPLQISDPLAQKRFAIAGQDFLDHLYFDLDERGEAVGAALAAVGAIGADAIPPDDVIAGRNLWQRYDWQLSLGCFLWSMRDEFVDHGHDYDDKRCRALEALLEAEPLPLPERIPESEAVRLPDRVDLPAGHTVGTVLGRRRTATRFRKDPVPAATLAGLLHHGFVHSRRYHIPNIEEDVRNILQGCGFAIDPYIAAFNVQDIEPGIYRYSVSDDRLKVLARGCFRSAISNCLIGHRESEMASFTLLFVAEFERFQWRYRHERALRNLYVDVGRMAQFFILVATAYDLATHITPACRDDQLLELLGLDLDRHQVLHTVTIGLKINSF